MKITVLTPDRYPEYEKAFRDHGSVFNDLKWLSMFGRAVVIYVIENKENKIAGSFYSYEKRIFGIKFARTSPFTPSNALFFINDADNASKKSRYQKSLASDLSDFYCKMNAGIIRVPFPPGFTDFQPFIWKKFKVIPNYTYIIDLNADEENIYSSFSPEKRNEIRKALNDGIELVPEYDYSAFMDYAGMLFENAGVKYDKPVLTKIFNEFADQNNSFAFVAKKADDILAWSFCVHDNHSAYYLLGGTSGKSRHPGAGSAVLWESIKTARNLGLKSFDFEGSMIPGIEAYFREFGGTLTPYFTINKAFLPIEIVLKFIRREYF